jgi:hypothetical protein
MIRTAEQLSDYCKRALGEDVINIEISEMQCSDRITDTIEKFIHRHHDGVTEMIFNHAITLDDVENGYVTLPSEIVSILDILKSSSDNSFEVFDNIEYNLMYDIVLQQGGMWNMTDYYLNMRHLSLVNFLMSGDNAFEYNSITRKLYPRFKLKANFTGNLLKSPKDISLSDWTVNNSVLTGNDVVMPSGKSLGDTVTSAGAGVFGFSQEIETKTYVRGLYTQQIYLLEGSYTGDVVFTMEDGNGLVIESKTITLPSLWEKFIMSDVFDLTAGKNYVFRVDTVDAAAGAGEDFFIYKPHVYKNNSIIVRGYKTLNEDEYENIYNDEWVKKYAIQKIKQQWGTNTKKYQGVQLPGGIEITGQQIYDEATTELEKLDEEFSLTYELPPAIFFG